MCDFFDDFQDFEDENSLEDEYDENTEMDDHTYIPRRDSEEFQEAFKRAKLWMTLKEK